MMMPSVTFVASSLPAEDDLKRRLVVCERNVVIMELNQNLNHGEMGWKIGKNKLLVVLSF